DHVRELLEACQDSLIRLFHQDAVCDPVGFVGKTSVLKVSNCNRLSFLSLFLQGLINKPAAFTPVHKIGLGEVGCVFEIDPIGSDAILVDFVKDSIFDRHNLLGDGVLSINVSWDITDQHSQCQKDCENFHQRFTFHVTSFSNFVLNLREKPDNYNENIPMTPPLIKNRQKGLEDCTPEVWDDTEL